MKQHPPQHHWPKLAFKYCFRKEKFAEQSEAEKAAFEDFIEEYEATLALLQEDHRLLRFRGVEADDIAAHLVKHRDKYGLEYIWLISSDRDWDLLIQENVARFSSFYFKSLQNWPNIANFLKTIFSDLKL